MGVDIAILESIPERCDETTALIEKLGRKDIQCLLVGSDQGREGYRRELEQEIERRGLSNVIRRKAKVLIETALIERASWNAQFIDEEILRCGSG